MSDTPNNDDGQILQPQAAPDHGPDFWSRLDAQLGADAPTAALPAVNSAGDLGVDPATATSEMGAVVPMRSPRTVWPMAAAAALLLVVGLGFLVARAGNDPASTSEIVAGESGATDDEASVVPSDGPTDEAGDSSADQDLGDDSTSDAPDDDADDSADVDAPDDVDAAGANAGSSPATDVAAPTPTPVPVFDVAPGASGQPLYLARDQGVPANALHLASWPERALSWYAVPNAGTSCSDPNHTEIRYVNGSGLTQDVHDPQLGFSGALSHFVVRPGHNQAALLSTCGAQTEFYVADLADDGSVMSLNLVWFGESSSANPLVSWDDTEVSLNAISPSGLPFALAYDTSDASLTRNGGPTRFGSEAGAPAFLSSTPLAASADASVSYWAVTRTDAGVDNPGTNPCPSGTQTAVASLWLRTDNEWLPAVVSGPAFGTLTAAAIEPSTMRVAFADECGDAAGRVYIGTQVFDGQMSSVELLDLTPYVPGHASDLSWVDAQTLRIKTDNERYGVDPVRFDYQVDTNSDGQTGVIVQLD